jgi:thioredoxin-related protein
MTNIPRHRLPIWLFALAVIGTAAADCSAQQVQWRSDYNAVRKEALEKHRPIIIDFGAENCFWCKKLDLTTLRDPAVTKLLSEQFVALKADAERDQTLTQALRISQFPTLLLASPDGKIIGVLEGYQEAAVLAGELSKVASSFISPEWMNHNFQEAAKAIAASDYSRAVVLLKSITSDGKDRSVQVKARQVLADLEQQAAARLVRAKQMTDRGQSGSAAETLADLLRAFAGTQSAKAGSSLLTTIALKPEVQSLMRNQRARELLAQARDDLRSQDYLSCLVRCESLTTSYSDLPEGAEARQLVVSIKDNPEQFAQACENLNRRMGVMYLTLAESWLKKGEMVEAKLCLEKVLRAAPGSPQAVQAQVHMSKLQSGSATLPADFRKP